MLRPGAGMLAVTSRAAARSDLRCSGPARGAMPTIVAATAVGAVASAGPTRRIELPLAAIVGPDRRLITDPPAGPVLSWAILVPDAGTMIFATVTGLITVFNLIWWSLRILGLRPLPAAGHRRPPSHGQPASDQGPPRP